VHALDLDRGSLGERFEGFESFRRVLDGARALVGEFASVTNSGKTVLFDQQIDRLQRRSKR